MLFPSLVLCPTYREDILHLHWLQFPQIKTGKGNFRKEKNLFLFFFFLFPRGFEESSEGCHCSAVFNVNQNAQTWVTSSLTVFFLPPPSPGAGIVTRSKIASCIYSIFKMSVINRPLFVRRLTCLWWGFSCLYIISKCLWQVSSLFFYIFL